MTHDITDSTPDPDATNRQRTTDSGPEDPATDLHFAYAADPPEFERFDVKTLTAGELLGAPCTFAVIGQSHLVSAPELDYHEVCSCDPLPAAACETTTLDPGASGSVAFESDSVRAETAVRVEPLAAFPGAGGADVAYRFGPDAWTTLTVAPDGGEYETYHTYPERDASVRTRTTLTRVGDAEGPAVESSAVEDSAATPEGQR